MKKAERVFGLHAVTSLLERNPARVSLLQVLESRDDPRIRRVLDLAGKANVPVRRVSRRELDELVPGVSHQGVVAETGEANNVSEHELTGFIEQLEHPAFLLILDGIQDPHNLGACIRSADAAGVDAVILPRDRSAPMNATVRKVACGAAEVVPVVRVTNLARVMRQLRDAGIWIYGAAGEAETCLYDTDLSGSLACTAGGIT